MGRNKIMGEEFHPPTAEEVALAIEAVGGKGEASRLCRKRWSSIDRWCKGESKIDFANWELIKSKKREEKK